MMRAEPDGRRLRAAPVLAYSFAAATVLAAGAVRLLLDPVLGHELPFATQYVAVALAARYAGARAGLAAIGLGGLLVWVCWLGLGSAEAIDPRVIVSLALYVATAGFVVLTVQAMRRAEASLLRERNRFQVILESIDDAVITVGLDHRIGFLNRPAERLLGCAAPVVLGRIFSEAVQLIDRRSMRRLTDLLSPVPAAADRDAVLVAMDGRETPVNDRLAPLRDEDQRIVGAALTLTDLSLQKRYEQDQRQSDARTDEFLAILAHELRNPLNPLQCAVAVLRQSGGAGRMTAALDVIQRQLDQMVRLVDDLMDVSRIRNGRFELRRAVVGLDTLLAAAAEAVQPLVTVRQQRFERAPTPAAAVHGDAARLTQVLTNGLNNASKYTAPGGWIRMTASADEAEVCVEIADGGIGLSAADMTRIFELFTRVDSARGTIDGLGVGLALARRLVEMHEGRIEVASAGPGHGTTFRIVLPRCPQRPVAPVPDRAAAPPVRPKRVLLVDDHPDGTGALAMLLESMGYEVAVAETGAEALRRFVEFEPEAAVLDIGLPDMSGLELARRLRALASPRLQRLIALTGWGTAKDLAATRAAGFDAHVTKPIRAQQIVELIDPPPR